ncbi:MAG: isoprenylcysteine carboxylmethyltransferase family protein [Acidobacteriota bacterium]|nr:isoprenylcysteine carboxylmethyltransferase family protein [Acidobacteriota bacterium]
MSEENPFRIGLALVFLPMLAAWTTNLLRVGLTRDVFYGPAEGLLVAVPIRVLMVLSVTAIVAYLAQPGWMSWSSASIPAAVRWLGLPLGLGSVALAEWTFRSLGRGFSMSITIRDRQALVRDGPYRRVRHPLYTAFLLMWISFSLLSANWFIAATGIGGYAIGMIVRTPREEALLIEAFGQEYVEYKRRTSRYLPRIGGSRRVSAR